MATMSSAVLRTGTPNTRELSHLTSGFIAGSRKCLSCFTRVGPCFARESFPRSTGAGDFQQLRNVKVAAEGKGFGKVIQKSKKSFGKVEKGSGDAASNVCPCGGGAEKTLYSECCARYHGGVIEPDAETLMKARFSAYALGVVPYVVKTTHPKNPDFEGVVDFAADVKATCDRLRFVKLDVLEFQEVSETEATVSFVVTYSILKGGRGEGKHLKEKSIFVKENDRWLYRDREAFSQASEAEWLASTFSNVVDPNTARKSFMKGTTTKPGFSGLNSGGETRASRIHLNSRTGGK